MSIDDVDSGDPNVRRDRREHGGADFDRLDDDELARRTEQERVDAGVEAYDPDDVPPATDDPVPYDESADEQLRETRATVERQAAEGELYPPTEAHPFPPTRYEEQ